MPIQHNAAPHRRTLRLPNYDYSQPGLYFITICTQDRKWMLGEIVNDDMCLNIAGTIVQSTWKSLPQRFPHLELDQHIIMPNHLHGIITLTGTSLLPQKSFYTASVPARFRQSTFATNSTSQQQTTDAASQSDRVHQNPTLGDIIRTLKGASTRSIHATGAPDFAWQNGYYEHIIRNDEDLDRIRHYIINNPARWAEDYLYTETSYIAPSRSANQTDSPTPPRGTR